MDLAGRRSFDREAYLSKNTGYSNDWYGQRLDEPQVVVVGGVAVLRCVVVDDVDVGAGRQSYRMPMTQTWVRGARRLRSRAVKRTSTDTSTAFADRP